MSKPSRKKAKPPATRKPDEQLGFFPSEVNADLTFSETPHPYGRYHQNGAIEKRLGAVYTPPRVAAALTRWAVRSPADRVLDPACGEGVFLAAARTRLGDLGARDFHCVGVDIDPEAAQTSGAHCEDFFVWRRTAPRFDVILGNPPFVRSHRFAEESRRAAFSEMVRLGMKPSRLMSTWLPFVTLCSHLLTERGRLAFVVPEELLHVGYAEELRRILVQRFRRVVICLPSEGVFATVQQAVVLLLCDQEPGGPQGLSTIDYADLEAGQWDALSPASPWSWNHKWTHLFLEPKERERLDEWRPRFGWAPLSEYGRVEVGVVTGDNAFFIVNQERAADLGEAHLAPIVTGSKAVRGICFGPEDFQRLVEGQRPAFLLNVRESMEHLPGALRAYLELGQRQGVSQRYKCRVREPWYAVPGIRDCDALLLRQAGEMPRLIHLAKRCTATDTLHRVNWLRPEHGRRHVVGFLNTWTLLACELTGRSYGGGVLELMPSEANRLPLPEPTRKLDQVFDPVDELVRARRYYEAVSVVDQVVKPDWMSRTECEQSEQMLRKLIRRRNAPDQGSSSGATEHG